MYIYQLIEMQSMLGIIFNIDFVDAKLIYHMSVCVINSYLFYVIFSSFQSVN